MERELRELLERKGAEVRPGFEIPPGILRRARRRRVRTAVLTAVVAGALGLGGFFVARAALDGSLAESPPAQPAGEGRLTEDEVLQFVTDFMERRINGAGAEALLSEEAKDHYDAHVAGLYLYKPTSSPYYGDFEFLRVEPIRAGYWVVVRVAEELYPAPGVAVSSFVETLVVGSGTIHERTQGNLVILSAARDNVVTFPTQHEARDLVSAFMERRFTGRRAEPFLSPNAQGQYDAGAERLSLYQPSAEPEWRGYEIISVTPAEADQYEVTVVITVEYPSTTEGDTITEVLILGPGANVQGFEARLVVREAMRIA